MQVNTVNTKSPLKFKHTKFFISIAVMFLIISLLILSILFSNKEGKKELSNLSSNQTVTSNMKLIEGERTDNQGCTGTGPITFTTSPMNIEDIGTILPLGAMIGAHVTPIDHMYFSPKVFHSPRDTYEVYAMADGIITSISERTQNVTDQNNGSPKLAEYQMKFWYTCDFASYYDLITSLSPRLKDEFEKNNRGGQSASVNIPIKAGELVGRIGGQTLDFAVYDYTKILPGFIVPEHYLAESWKIHVVDPFQYFDEPLRSQLLALNPRQAEPRAGKIDYDIDGKLVGTWFKEGNNGFGDTGGQNPAPWRAHLSFAYDSIDPTGIVISIGDYNGESQQFAVKGNSPDPATVSMESGMVKYELTSREYYRSSTGQIWNYMDVYADIKMRAQVHAQGTALVQLIGTRKLKFEAFPGKTIKEVTGFSEKAMIYER